MGFLCISEGYLLCYSDKFEVIDIQNNSIRKDVNARSRMTRKSLLSFRERLSSFCFVAQLLQCRYSQFWDISS